MRTAPAALAALAQSLLGACVFPPLSLDGLHCDRASACAPGYTCVAGLCTTATDAGPSDRTAVVDGAGGDGPTLDVVDREGGVRDQAPADAASDDGTTGDRGSVDHAMEDATVGDSTAEDATGFLSQQLAIAHTLDDGEIVHGWQNQWYPGGEGAGITYLGYYATGGTPVWGYFRFELASAIPAGSAIRRVILILRGRSTYSWDPQVDALAIAAEARADALRVTGENDRPGGGSGTTLTAAAVRWPAFGGLHWDTAGPNRSPELSPLVQELVDAHGGLAAGAHVQLWLRSPDAAAASEVGAEDFSFASGTGLHARLDIEWTQP